MPRRGRKPQPVPKGPLPANARKEMIHVRKQTAINLCKKCVGRIQYRGARATLQNPAVLFARDEKRGRFRGMPEDVVEDMRAEAEEAAVLWDGKSRRAAGAILADVLAGSVDKDLSLRRRVAEAFAGLLADDPDGGTPADDWTPDDVAASAAGADMEVPFEGAPLKTFPEPLPDRSPAEIRDAIACRVLGQPEAAKAAALIVHNHLAGRRTNAVFAGPSGCGKSEIWRVLAREYPGLVRMVDFSRFASEGWAGSLHVRDIFDGMDTQSFQQYGMIAVLDEADKILCEPAVGAGGTDHHALLQNDLLKIMDGDVVEFGAEGKKDPMSVDCSRVSVVMLGAFERLREGQARAARRIGFGHVPSVPADSRGGISHGDLIAAGMRREIAGRVNRITELGPLTADDYKAILQGPVLAGVREAVGQDVRLDDAAAAALAARALETGLGVRWMRSEILNAVDDVLFGRADGTDAPEIDLSGRLP